MGFIWLLGLCANAQNTVVLHGKVKSTDKDVADVYVINLTLKKSTITDADGNFRIEVERNDTLQFSALTYKTKEIVITKSVWESNAITVTLEEFVNELNEVTVRPYNLSGHLGSDVGTLQTDPVVTANTLGLPNANARRFTQSERLLKEASGMSITGTTSGLGAGGAVSLNPIINAITGRTKRLKKRVAVDKEYRRTLRVKNLYTDTTFVRDFKIPLDKIDAFMYFCEADKDFKTIADSGDALRIWEFLKSKSTAYRKNNKLN